MEAYFLRPDREKWFELEKVIREMPPVRFREIFQGQEIESRKEETTMQVSYNGFTGELVRLERKVIDPESLYIDSIPIKFSDRYELQIFTPENGGIAAFTGVNLKDVKILGGSVMFDG